MKPMDNPSEHTHECLFAVFYPERARMQSPGAIFCKKVLNWYRTFKEYDLMEGLAPKLHLL